jgi:hypothetical protein
MIRLLEDILSEDVLRAIDAVHSSNFVRFDKLVSLAGLDPSSDFQFSDLRSLDLRGSDLRGFDFTGSDLRYCLISDATMIDDTTILDEAMIDWIDAKALPIVQKMQEIEVASSQQRRQQLLAELIAEHGRTDHVVTYMIRAAGNATEVGQFLDFVSQLPRGLNEEQLNMIQHSGKRLIRKKLGQAKSRTRRDKTAILAVEPALDRLRNSPGELGKILYEKVAEVVNAKTQTNALGGIASVELSDIEAAFTRLSMIKT